MFGSLHHVLTLGEEYPPHCLYCCCWWPFLHPLLQSPQRAPKRMDFSPVCGESLSQIAMYLALCSTHTPNTLCTCTCKYAYTGNAHPHMYQYNTVTHGSSPYQNPSHPYSIPWTPIQHPVPLSNTLYPYPTPCTPIQHPVPLSNTLHPYPSPCTPIQHPVPLFNTLYPYSTPCTPIQHPVPLSITLYPIHHPVLTWIHSPPTPPPSLPIHWLPGSNAYRGVTWYLVYMCKRHAHKSCNRPPFVVWLLWQCGLCVVGMWASDDMCVNMRK